MRLKRTSNCTDGTVAIFARSGAKNAANLVHELSEKINAPVGTTYKSQLELTGVCKNYVGQILKKGCSSF